MQLLYSERNLSDIRGQIKKRLLALGAVSVLFLAAIVYTLILDNHKDHRPEVWTTVLTLVWLFSLIFGFDLLVRPLYSYAKHLQTSLHGRTHEVVCEFSRAGENESVVDGVVYRDLIFLGEADKHGDRDRLFYWDAELPVPAFAPGSQIRVQYYDRFMTGYEVLS